MAYISAEDVKRIRNAIKIAFPEFKFSVRKDGYLGVYVSFVSGPVDFNDVMRDKDSGYCQINEYWLQNYGQHQALFEAVLKIIKMAPEKQWYNNSDAQIDYFDTAFYIHMQIGNWNKPYVYKAPKKAVETDYESSVRVALAATKLAA